MSASYAPAPAPSITGIRSRFGVISEWFFRADVLIRVVVYLTAAIYLRTVLFDYVYDDNSLIILNPWMESWRYVPSFFTHSFWSFTDAVRPIDYYRPLVMLALASVRHLLGPAPGWFHLVAAGIHVAATYLTYRLAVETTGDKTLAAIAAGIFGLHPTKVETAAWISGISDSLCVVFFLGSMIAYFKWRREQESQFAAKYLWISLVLLLLALFSKEAAIFAPILLGVYEFANSEGRLRMRCLQAFRRVWPFAVLTTLLVAIRVLVVPMPSGSVAREIPLASTIMTAPMTVLWYFGKQIWPVPLSIQYPLLVISRFSILQVVLPTCVLLALTVAVFWAVRNSATGIFFTAWFLLMLAPVILYQVRLQQHDRYFYLPSVATSIGLAYLITSLKVFGNGIERVAVLLLFGLMAGCTFACCSYWDNDQALFTRAVQIAPFNSNACRYLAGLYINEHYPEKAEALARTLIQQPEGRPTGWYILGTVRLTENNYESARTAMQHSIEYSSGGNHLLASIALADIDVLLNKNEEAIQIYRQELKEYPQMALLRGRLATALKNLSKSEHSAPEIRTAQRSSALL